MAQVAQYRDDGYVFPVDVLSAEEVARYRGRLEAFEAAQGRPLDGAQRAKSYLLFDWLHQMITRPAVLDAVEDLIGPDILVFYLSSWIKERESTAFVSWHQDATYFGLEPAEHVTAWIALSPSTPETGCVRVLPASHRRGQLAWRREVDSDNLLSSGQNVDLDIDPSQAVDMVLAPGQMSLHHTYLVHGSGPNRGGERRIGFAVSFIPTRVRQAGRVRCSALLVRGEDRYNHFLPETPPVGNADPVSAAAHAAALALYREKAVELGNLSVSRYDSAEA